MMTPLSGLLSLRSLSIFEIIFFNSYFLTSSRLISDSDDLLMSKFKYNCIVLQMGI